MRDQWYVDALTTWADVLDRQVERHGEKTLFVFEDQTMTYAEFGAAVDRFAKGLIALGVRKDDVAAIWMTNSIDWVVCQFAIYKVGATLLPLYSYYRRPELEYALDQAQVSTLIMADSFLGKIDALAILEETIPELRTTDRNAFASAKFPALKRVILAGEGEDLPGRHSFDDVCTRGDNEVSDYELLKRQTSVSPFDLMNIMYTSGTTGFPKGGMSMHVTNLTTIGQWSQMAELGPDDVILCHVPLFTNFGGLYGAALGIRNGAKVVITEQFDAAQSLRLIEAEKVTYIPGTPSMFRMMLDHPDVSQRDLSSVRGGHVAGAPLTDTTMREILEVLGAENIMQAWGLSECGGLSTVSTRHHPRDKRLKSVGKPLKSAVVRVVNSDTFEDMPAGAQGEIILGDRYPGSCVGRGYYGMPDKTAAAITEDGWFRTGDVGFFDEEGFLYITGRVDDMFTVGGFNIYPAEIENKLEQLPGVKEAFIVPVADRRLGNVPAAWIARAEGTTIDPVEIVEFCRRTMTSQKAPRRVFFYESGDLPMTPAGKLKKKDLTARTAALVEADAGAGLVLQPETQQ
ncbi:AMP-binding protein [Nitratireductor mangrovi]|uniref:AMP-binding protein n=1 Tax=Nitratireductor mangrovi TaxID=2599600 RepID=A0A5B8KTR2_9HYPH|nr:AMP-binding protein [Nitratireductor mangrovi]QDY98960.1 AMP-binding protein [Nitratireductor mangrovi]